LVDTSITHREVFMAAKKRYSAEFRVQAVRLMRERVAAGVGMRRVGEELGINPELVRFWARAMDVAPAEATPEEIFPGTGRKRPYKPQQPQREEIGPESAEEELTRLRRENQRLRQERDFLKKAAAFFAKESQ
jgi:transposase